MFRTGFVKSALGVTLLSCLLASTPLGAQVVYNRGNDADPETLDVHKTSTVYESHILRDLYDGLLIKNNKGEVVPSAAETFTISPDGLTYSFKLRGDAKWSNGDAVKASDFLFSLRRIMNPDTGAKYANILYPIKNAEKINKKAEGAKIGDLGVAAPDDRTFIITLERATPYFAELLTHQTGLPVHPGSVERLGADFAKPGNMISNGAYTLKEWVPNSHIRLEKNANFYDAKNVKIDVVMVQPHKDIAAAVRRFEAGELHSTTDLPADQVKQLRAKFGTQVKVAPYLGTYYLAVNTSKPGMSDVRVRTALSMAIDREFIAEQIWGGTMFPAYGFVPPGIGNYGEPAEADYKSASPIDREVKAKDLLKQAGFGPGLKPLKVELRYNTTDNNRATAVAIADMWKQIGVETTFINTDAKTHFAHLREGGDFDVARAGWIGDYSDPQNFLFLVQADNKGFNYAKYNNPVFDGLMTKAAAEPDIQKRAAILLEADQLMVKDKPYIPVLFYSTRQLVSSRIEGFNSNLSGVFPTRYLSIKP